jgi:hypothetical protein
LRLTVAPGRGLGEDARMQMILGVLLVIFGLVGVGNGLFSELGDGGFVTAVMSGAAVLAGIGLIVKSEFRQALFAMAAACFMFGVGMGVFVAIF